jgi:lysophospholipase L1-like esterase
MTRFRDIERALTALVALGSAVVAVTCASRGRIEPPLTAPASPAASTSAAPSASNESAVSSAAASASSAPAASSSAPVAVPDTDAFELPHLFRALRDLKEHARKQPVRVLWLGDSHTYADFWPDALRGPLQARFGNGGPGYLLIGIEPYRHAGVQEKRTGLFHHEPIAPSTAEREADGVFGLGGMRALPAAGDASVEMRLEPDAVSGRASFTVLYRLTRPGASFRVSVSGASPVIVGAQSGEAGPSGSPIRRVTLQGGPEATLKLSDAVGQPELFGVIVESAEPGVVVDTLGINGARAATALAWDAKSWEAEARARQPSLVVLAYGTNEVPLLVAPDRYAADFADLIERVRQAAPNADCLLAGPTDWDLSDGVTNPRVVEIDQIERRVAAEHGCSYFSTFEAMGGEGSHRRWEHASPELGAVDHIHLTPDGYAKLGGEIAKAVLLGYSRFTR